MIHAEYPPTHLTVSRYGYWITNCGKVLNVESPNGHIPFLMDCCEFDGPSTTDPYWVWYETAFLREWVRVVAPADMWEKFRFQFKVLAPATRISLISLIGTLPPYGEYVLEASEPRVFDAPEKAMQFVEQYHNSITPGHPQGNGSPL